LGETALMWLRRVVSAPLIVLAFVCAIGAVRIFMHNLPDSTFGDGIFATSVTAAAGAAAFFLLRPDLRRLSLVGVREWCLRNPLGQATALYLVAAILMVAAPSYMLGPAVLAMCVFSVASAWSAALQRRWWVYALLALLGWCVLFLALGATAEALAPRGFGEGAMVFLLPVQVFPALLLVSGIVRLVRGRREQGRDPAP
jgi:hypothetical protein